MPFEGLASLLDVKIVRCQDCHVRLSRQVTMMGICHLKIRH